MTQVVLDKVSKIYDKGIDHKVRTLCDTSFRLKKGEFVVIIGASSTGKSTLLNILGGMDTLTSGEFIVPNKKINQLNDKRLSLCRRNDGQIIHNRLKSKIANRN